MLPVFAGYFFFQRQAQRSQERVQYSLPYSQMQVHMGVVSLKLYAL